MSDAIVVDDLGFAWPDGQVLFDGLSFAVGPGRSGLIGANGSGKSTLLRLIAGELVPARGLVQVTGSLGYLRQDLTLAAHRAVEEVLGIARARRAVRAIERGEATAERFAAVGAWSGVMVLVSHDRGLLELVDQVAELRGGAIRWYGGNLTAYEAAVAAEQEVAQRLVRTAASDVAASSAS